MTVGVIEASSVLSIGIETIIMSEDIVIPVGIIAEPWIGLNPDFTILLSMATLSLGEITLFNIYAFGMAKSLLRFDE